MILLLPLQSSLSIDCQSSADILAAIEKAPGFNLVKPYILSILSHLRIVASEYQWPCINIILHYIKGAWSWIISGSVGMIGDGDFIKILMSVLQLAVLHYYTFISKLHSFYLPLWGLRCAILCATTAKGFASRRWMCPTDCCPRRYVSSKIVWWMRKKISTPLFTSFVIAVIVVLD